ncbi:MAG: hypothetical protein U0903_19705 [Planctomycetales bacterium]
MLFHANQSGFSSSPALEVYLLGIVDYESCLTLQERFLFDLSGRRDGAGVLLLCEHPPLITIGREGSRAQILCEPRELVARRLETRWINRGGGAIVHGPGQLACYPLIPLERRGVGLAEFSRMMAESVLRTARDQRITAHCTEKGSIFECRSGEFGMLGSAVKSWISYHGLFVNVNPLLDYARLVAPQGTTGRITSLAAERMHPIGMHSVRESLIRHIANLLGYERYHLYTGHPALKRTRRTYVHAGNH